MNKLIIASLITTLCVLTENNSSRSQNAVFKQPDLILNENGKPVSNTLNTDRCKSDFKLCVDVLESANIIPYVYRNGRTQKQTQEDAISNLSIRDNCNESKTRCYSDANWDKGYNPSSIHFVDTSVIVQNATEKRDKVEVDLQAILASKEYQEGGKTKRKFLITIKGTEIKGSLNPFELDLRDANTDIAALSGSRNINDGSNAKVPRGFWDSAYVLVDKTKAYEDLLIEIKTAADKNEDFEVLITGHSLGGAIATIVKAKIENSLEEKDKNRVKAITFGSPPAGNKEFNDRYGKNVTAISIEGDPVPLSPIPDSQVVGTRYQFRMSDNQRKVNEQLNAQVNEWSNPSTYTSGLIGIIGQVYNADKVAFDAAKVALIDTHAAGYNNQNIANYSPATSTGWYYLRNQLTQMNNQLTGIIQGGSSPIGSASYFIGNSSNRDQEIINANTFNEVDIKSAQQNAEYTAAGSTVNLKAPVDILLNWDQTIAKGQLDLDSHLTGPTSLGADSPVRFHTYFGSSGSVTDAPFVKLYKDVIPKSGTSGPEQTRIQVLQDGVYRFYVHDYTNRENGASSALANSGANVNIYQAVKGSTPDAQEIKNNQLGQPINVPTNGKGNVWYSFRLNSRTGILQRVNINIPFGNEASPSQVPKIGESITGVVGSGK